VTGTDRLRLGAIGFAGGMAAGLALWGLQVHRYRRDLFSRSPIRRLGALGYLEGQPGIESARLLADYVNWETQPVLRRRGQLVLRRMEAYLD
jgi:hypothetical protein